MTYPRAAAEHVAFFKDHGWIVVKDAIPQADLDLLAHHCERILDNKDIPAEGPPEALAEGPPEAPAEGPPPALPLVPSFTFIPEVPPTSP